jgi:hypothetical protein
MPIPVEMAEELWRFAPHTFAQRASGGKWQCPRHLNHIGQIVTQKIIEGNGRLIINMPVRHGKSVFISTWLPIWFLNTWPEKRVLLAAYGEELANDWGRIVRNEFATNPMLTTALRDDSKAVGRWHTPEGGGMIAAGAGSAISGRGGDLMIADDLVKNWQEAHSYSSKQGLWEWWRSTFATRKEPNATMIVAMTRWTDDDICARLQTEFPGEWTVIRLPSLAEVNDPLGRAEGDPLWPERFDKTAMLRERRAAGAAVWAALYQQAPELGCDRLYRRFSPNNVDDSIALRHDLPLCTAWDFNISPGNHVEIFQYDAEKDLFFFLDEIHEERIDVRGCCDRLRSWIQERRAPTGFQWKELQIYGDATGGSQWAGSGDSCYDIMQRALASVPHRIRRPAANPPVIDRVNTVNEALCDVDNQIHVRIHPRCVRLLEDLRKMKPDAQGLEDKHEAKLSHASSGAGYAICFLRPLYRDLLQMRGGEWAFGSQRITTASPNLNGGQVANNPLAVDSPVYVSRGR